MVGGAWGLISGSRAESGGASETGECKGARSLKGTALFYV
ncbi:hypothetical protein C8J35_102477 [Rhizobium sp. PP-F2F-G38]|nr:hypothetical protein C8J37_102477 [Rhizobium sp. PP-WC-1G-195]PYE99587.1 hypothetical protein C8J35_102477 [Rhizobium sp. PP-F2F-G38]TCQ12230.1 hypothetical protein C8J34_101870 [Rhizobium sp. PP-F2F-G36]